MDATQGFEVTANNSYHFPNTNIKGIFEIGFRQLYFSGSSDNIIYNGQLNKLIGSLGCGYSLSEKLIITGFLEAENKDQHEEPRKSKCDRCTHEF